MRHCATSREPRTVTARTEGLLYALDREVFIAGITGHRYTSSAVESVVEGRLAAG